MTHQNDQHQKEVDPISGVETTGHEWDGLKELNNPAPRWWLWVWLATFIWAIAYWIAFPAWPTLSGHTAGLLGWTEYKKLAVEQGEIQNRQSDFLSKVKDASLEQVATDPTLRKFAIAGGRAAFKDNCAVCHGTGAQGGKGFPNLNDNDWLWGGKLEDIYHTLTVGVRSTHPDTRTSQMPSFGKDEILTKDQVNAVVDHVLSLSGKGEDNAEGATIFAENCAVCHGEKGQGNREFGAPRLSDAIWLYGGDRDTVYETVWFARRGVMPTWSQRLDETTLKELAVYVHSLGGGEE